MKVDFDLLKACCMVPGAPGFEAPIRRFVLQHIKPYVDEVYIDNMGNLLATKFAKKEVEKKQTLMVTAHMDEISFIVSHIDDKGFVRFRPLGGFDPKTLTAQRVIIHGSKDVVGVMGCKPIHLMTTEERAKSPDIKDYFIDTGLSKKEIEQYIEVGQPITREREIIQMGQCINGKALDNRVSVYILIEYLKRLHTSDVEVVAAFTTQEEVGLRGAQVAAQRVNPDFGINLDVTVANDLPGSSAHEYVTALGQGAAIKVLDGQTICDQRMVSFIKTTAKENGIAYQLECLPFGGTDTAALQREGMTGSIAGGISIPTRYLHQVIELAHQDDILNCLQLLEFCTYSMGGYGFGYD